MSRDHPGYAPFSVMGNLVDLLPKSRPSNVGLITVIDNSSEILNPVIRVNVT